MQALALARIGGGHFVEFHREGYPPVTAHSNLMTSTNLSPHSLGGATPPDEFVPANNICRELRLLTGKPCPVSARGLIKMAADDKLPLEQHGDARWWGCWRRRLPEVAQVLGMLPAEPSDTPTDQLSAA